MDRRLRLGIASLACLLLLAVLALPSSAAAAPTGPIYPLPGNATTGHGGNTCDATGTSAGLLAGVTWTFGGGLPATNNSGLCPTNGPDPAVPFNTDRFQNLYWGANGNALPRVSMDGPFDATETLSFRAGESSLPDGKVTWGGTTHMDVCISPCTSFTEKTVDTRVVLTITTLADAPVALLSPGDAGIANLEVGGVVSVTPTLRNYKANIKVLARIQPSLTFLPADTVFNSFSNHEPVTDPYRISFSGAFWYVNRPPLADFTFTPADPKAFTPVTFTATVSDADGSVASLGWDFNNDGQYQESTAEAAQWSFSPGAQPARLRVVDNEGTETIVEKVLQIPPPPDVDGDGYLIPADCDDSNPAVHPNAPEIPNNGADEDCNGIVAVDADLDGSFAPPGGADCNDTNAAIHPGATDKPGNKIDENCDGFDTPAPLIPATVSYTYEAPKSSTKFTRFQVKLVPRGSKVTAQCKGSKCPNRPKKFTKRGARGTVKLKGFTTRFPAGVVIEVRVTHTGMIGVVKRVKVRANKAPVVATKCLPPGAREPTRCT
jgi:hypothetical protein